MVQVTAAVKVLALVVSTGGGVARTRALIVAADVGQRPGHTVLLASDGAGNGLVGKVHPTGLPALVVDDHVHEHASVAVVEGGDHLTQLRLGAKTGVVLQPINGHVAHALGGAVGIDAARIGHPHHVKILAQFLSVLGQGAPLGGLVAVPVEALQHHAAVHRRPALAGNRCGAALTRDDTRQGVHVDGDVIGSCRNTERDVHIITKGIQGNGLAQCCRSHPVVALAHGRETVGQNAIPVIAAGSQLGREREVAHVGILLRPLAVEGHLGGEHIAVGSGHLNALARVPAIAVGLAQDVQVPGQGIDGLTALVEN